MIRTVLENYISGAVLVSFFNVKSIQIVNKINSKAVFKKAKQSVMNNCG
jgi:hypothetical protein